MNGSVVHVDAPTSSVMGPNMVQFAIGPVYAVIGLQDGTVVKGGIIFLSRDLKHDRHQVRINYDDSDDGDDDDG